MLRFAGFSHLAWNSLVLPLTSNSTSFWDKARSLPASALIQLMAPFFFSLIVLDFFGNHQKLLYPTSTLPISGLALNLHNCYLIYPLVKVFLIPFCKLLILFPTSSTKVSELIWLLMLGTSGRFLIHSCGNKKWKVCPIPSFMGLAFALVSSPSFR